MNYIYCFLSNIKNFLHRYKSLICLVLIVFGVTFLTGCFYVAKRTDSISISFIKDFAIKRFLQNNISQIEFCFIKILFWLALFALAFVLSFFKIGCLFVILVFAYRSFCFGVTFVSIIHLFGFIKGFLVAIIGYFVIQFILIVSFCVLFLIISKYNKQFCSYGNCALRKSEIKIILKFFCIQVLLIILECFLLFMLKGLFIFI